MRTLKIALVAALLLVGAACSDDGGDGPEVSEKGKPYVESLSKSLKDDAAAEIDVTDDQADCLAAKWVEILKPERLEEKGVKPADFAEGDQSEPISTLGISDDEGNALVDVYGDCGINLREALIKSLREDPDTTEEEAKCFEGVLDEQLLRDVLVEGFVKGSDSLGEGSEASQKLVAAALKCQADASGRASSGR